MKLRSSRAALALLSIAIVACVSVYATLHASGRDSQGAGSPLVPKANYQFYFAQPISFPGYASPSASVSAQLIAVQDNWATIQYAAGPSKTAITVAINVDHLLLFYRLP